MKIKSILPIAIFFCVKSAIGMENSMPGEFSGEIKAEGRYFPNEGLYDNTEQFDYSFSFQPEYSYSWNENRKIITVIPFAIVSGLDSEKTHVDIREASYVAAYNFFEIRLGISKVYWGVTESQHLVDIINQTDAVLNIDSEDKLGQPMANVTLVTGFGNFDFFVLPYFRERTFPGEEGRFRGPLLVNTDKAFYEVASGDKHIDYAFRYSHSIGNFDMGVSIFNGTDRDPLLVLNSTASGLKPFYIQTTQVGLDIQYIFKSWLLKLEGIHKESKLRDNYYASTIGFEYTFSNIGGGGTDIGVLAEWLYDDRLDYQAIYFNHTFFGTRLAFNDEKSTEILLGFILNNEDNNTTSLRLEGGRRITEHWKWEVEASAIFDTKEEEQIYAFRDDDYFQLSVSYYF